MYLLSTGMLLWLQMSTIGGLEIFNESMKSVVNFNYNVNTSILMFKNVTIKVFVNKMFLNVQILTQNRNNQTICSLSVSWKKR